MDWTELAFLHWPVGPEPLRRLLPAGLELDTFDGSAWLGVVPFFMRMRFRWLPPLPGGHRFPEINLRTYVRHGDRGGVWFFSLDAASRLAVAGARLGFGLPYFDAEMRCDRRGTEVAYESERVDRRAPPAHFRARYRPAGEFAAAAAGTLEHFLTERYAMYVARRGRLLCGDVAHEPWRLARAEVDLDVCDMARLAGTGLTGPPVSAMVAAPQQVVAWTLRAPQPSSA